MTETESAFFATAAQVVPVIMLALGFQTAGFGFGKRARLQIPGELLPKPEPHESPEEYFKRVATVTALAMTIDETGAQLRALLAVGALAALVVAESVAFSVLATDCPFGASKALILIGGGFGLAILAFEAGARAVRDVTAGDKET